MPVSAHSPAPDPQPTSIHPSRWGKRVDVLSIGIVLGFALLAGSFVARNSDLWMHLAVGRLVAGGDYHFGSDPFAFTTGGKYWANHAWLFDLGLYLAFERFGGVGVVALKAFGVVATAGAMLFAARGRGPVWVAVGCVLLAVLAMTPRLLLQPTITSFLLLAGCLCCLRTGGRALVAVPVLIALWVNLDAWFILGPALVGLFWIGRRIDAERAALPAWPMWLIPASLAACLLSPHHIFALQLPMELSPSVQTSEFPSDPRFAGVFTSPWRWGPLGAAGGYNLAAWAFFVLFGLGLVSFAMNRRALWSWRSVVWLPFAVLAAWQARLIPFFAVVAGPIIALNFREVLPPTAFARLGRSFVLVAGSVLLGLGWIGWTNGFYNRDRGAAWGVYTDPTLARAASRIADWRHTTNIPPNARVFATHPDFGHYLAWFAPGEQCFLDSRLQLFTDVAPDFLALSQAVGVLPGEPSEPRELRRAHDIAAVVLYDPDAGRMTRGLRESTARWEVAKIDGGSVLLVPKGHQPSARFDPERATFGGANDLPVASGGPSKLAEPVPWWEVTRGRGRFGSWEADSATVFLRMFEIGSSNSPALPLLAIRAARVGTEIDAADPTAWLTLGRAYFLLGERTWEREAGSGLSLLEHLRLIQITAALVQAVLLNPDSVPIRESLAVVFLRRNAIDLAYRHAAEALRLVRRGGPLAGESAEAFADRVARIAKLVESLDGVIQDAENRFLIRTIALTGDPLARARIAAELGLTQKAIDVLIQSHPDLYGVAGIGVLADLLLQTGQVSECRVLLDRAELRRNTNVLQFYHLPRKPNLDGSRWPYQLHTYDWLDLCQCAASGRYLAASAAIDRLCGDLEVEERAKAPPLSAMATVLVTGEIGMGIPPIPILARLATVPDHTRATELLAHTKSLSISRADLLTLAGVFDLERGEVKSAEARFQLALSLYAGAKGSVLSLPGEPLAARYHLMIRKYH
ncbi:MAG: hypothetical protein L0241_09905 [Planctomycetia bacterium]|nr:hypothetical protein [Planctomycetia bacterium]